MDVKQEPSDILEGFTIKTEPGGFGETEQSKYCYSEDTVSENVQMFPKTFKQELVNIGGVKKLKETDISDIKQEVDEYMHKKTESELSELLTSQCDLPTLKIESTSDLGQCTSKSLENRAKKKRRYACPICQKNYSSSLSRSTHIDGHFKKRYVVCQFCGKLLKKIEVFQHFFVHAVKKRMKFHIDSKPLKKLQQKRNNIYVKSFTSDTSFKTFNNKSNLQKLPKLKYSNRAFKCNICFKRFQCKSILQQHLIIHSSEKPYKHGICSKSFKYNSNLQIVDTVEKPFRCEICSKGFKYNSFLQIHLIAHQVERPFKCEICSKSFKDKYCLKKHLINHNNRKSFNKKCRTCSKFFMYKSHLRQHLTMCSNEKPVNCDICSTKFIEKSHLRTHYSIVHGDKNLFKCDICSKGFTDRLHFRQHLIIHSGEKPFKE